jgi:hypothetical protein
MKPKPWEGKKFILIKEYYREKIETGHFINVDGKGLVIGVLNSLISALKEDYEDEEL